MAVETTLLTTVPTIFSVLNWFGIVVFAISGALAASRKQMDIIGFVIFACITAIGGGTVRDMMLGLTPVFWVADTLYIIVASLIGVLVFFTAHIPQSRFRLLLWADAIGISTFSVLGAQIAIDAGISHASAILMAVITASFGGIIRDVLADDKSILLRQEIYLTAILIGAASYIGLIELSLDKNIAAIIGFLACLFTRGLALKYNWHFPAYKSRPGRDY
ncbi:MAG: trimeric intracellular cation channel family protein [Rhizobiales bacterium]|nr:trimeric intracellular cation channel family protein [Hyphomicrobiales bacterium]NRB15231.1 trimeric intracellular cation channel family protein [Hyphomicrobiales bacterium]